MDGNRKRPPHNPLFETTEQPRSSTQKHPDLQMRIRRKSKHVFSKDIDLLTEVVLLLALARLAIAILPSRLLIKALGTPCTDTTPPPEQPHAVEEQTHKISRLIQGAARSLPWDCKCLAQAIVAKHMLTKRHTPNTLYIGTRHVKGMEFNAHAWLRSGEIYITGAKGHQHFTVLTYFKSRIQKEPTHSHTL